MDKVQRKHCGSRKALLILFCFAAVFLLGAVYASAQSQVPNGTYKQTCKSINYNSSTDKLAATCKRINGSWIRTNFNNPRQCLANHGDVENCNGTIECTGVGIPNVGSYKRSCFCCRMQNTRLACYCLTKRNTAHWTTLSDAGSYRNISNEDGTLRGRR